MQPDAEFYGKVSLSHTLGVLDRPYTTWVMYRLEHARHQGYNQRSCRHMVNPCLLDLRANSTMSHRLSRPAGFFCIVVCACLSVSARAQSRVLDLEPLEIPDLKRFDYGVTRSGTPLTAFITTDDLKVDVPKLRILIVAGLDGSDNTTSAAISVAQRFYSEERYQALREAVALSVVPCGNPDGYTRGLKNDNGAGGNPAAGYPPKGDAYNSPTQAEAQYLWRWIGMHAPDLVIELVDGPKRKILSAEDLPTDSLAFQLQKNQVCGVSKMESAAVSVPPGDRQPFSELEQNGWRDLIKGFQDFVADGGSEARREMKRRRERTALQLCEQLAKVYGHELPTPAYIPAVACIGRLRLAETVGDRSVIKDLERIGQAYLDGSKPSLTEKSSGSDIAGHILWGEMFDVNKDPRALKLVESAASRAFNDRGEPLEAMPTHSEMSDAVFMGCPILAQAGRLTGESRYYDMCLRHMRFMLKLNLRADGLHRHSPLDESAWGRGNGFPALGLTLALNDFPKDHAGRDELLAALKTHLRALKKHQDITGAWHQVIDHPESYRELTSTCMIVYAMARGVRMGWLDRDEFKDSIDKGWLAIKSRVRADGELVDVCTGTGKMKSLREYLDRTAILGRDPRGGAMSLLVATEMVAWERQTN